MGKMYRAQILLEPEQHQALTRIAQNDQRSISEVVREIVSRYLAEREQENQLQREIQALESLTEVRQQLQAEQGFWAEDMLAKIRAERDQEIGRVWGNEHEPGC